MLFQHIAFAVVAMILAVFIHEMGHFLAAKMLKLDVAEVHIGFAPTIYKFTLLDTPINIGLIMLGGIVLVPVVKGNALKQIVVILAGPLINYVFAVLLLFLLFSEVDGPVFLSFLQQTKELFGSCFNILLPNSSGSFEALITNMEFFLAPSDYAFDSFIGLFYLLNVVFAVFSMLPIPGTDGGSLVLKLIDLATKEKFIYHLNALNTLFLTLFFIYGIYLVGVQWVNYF